MKMQDDSSVANATEMPTTGTNRMVVLLESRASRRLAGEQEWNIRATRSGFRKRREKTANRPSDGLPAHDRRTHASRNHRNRCG
jgi:hypothetical protein